MRGQVYILAGTMSQYIYYTTLLQIDRSNVTYLNCGEQLKGQRGATILVCGTANQRDDYSKIMEVAYERESKILKLEGM